MGGFTKRLCRPAQREQDRLDAMRPHAEPCHNCAFRPGSPEREDAKTWELLLAQTDPAKALAPFYCHFKHDGTEMPTDAEGNYVPPLRKDGAPIGYPFCAGWMRAFDVKLERLHPRRDGSEPGQG